MLKQYYVSTKECKKYYSYHPPKKISDGRKLIEEMKKHSEEQSVKKQVKVYVN